MKDQLAILAVLAMSACASTKAPEVNKTEAPPPVRQTRATTYRVPPPAPPAPPKPVARAPITKEDVAQNIAKSRQAMRESDRAVKRLAAGFASLPRPSGPDKNAPRVGYVGQLNTDVASTFREMERFDQLILAEDDIGMKAMEENGSVWYLEEQSRILQVLPISPSTLLYYCELRITDGEKAGSTVWCSMTGMP